MHLVLTHNKKIAEIIAIINQELDKLIINLPNLIKQNTAYNLKVKKIIKSWLDQTLIFSFTLSLNVFNFKIKGNIRIEDDQIVLDGKLPKELNFFVQEEIIKELILNNFFLILNK